jgi:hypothetical protein
VGLLLLMTATHTKPHITRKDGPRRMRTVKQLLSNKITQIDVRHRFVDARLLENGIPLTHQRKFHVAAEVACISPNALPQRAHLHDHFTILGAGKTAMDSVCWRVVQMRGRYAGSCRVIHG